MIFPKRWFWYAYFYLYAVMAGYFTVEFFRPGSAVNLYYGFLLAFRPHFLVPYFLHLLAILVNLLSLAPFYSFFTRIPLFSRSFARWLFVARLGLEVFGRSYDIKGLQALSHQSPMVPLIIGAVYILFSSGSYWAHYRYAFRRDPSA